MKCGLKQPRSEEGVRGLVPGQGVGDAIPKKGEVKNGLYE